MSFLLINSTLPQIRQALIIPPEAPAGSHLGDPTDHPPKKLNTHNERDGEPFTTYLPVHDKEFEHLPDERLK